MSSQLDANGLGSRWHKCFITPLVNISSGPHLSFLWPSKNPSFFEAEKQFISIFLAIISLLVAQKARTEASLQSNFWAS